MTLPFRRSFRALRSDSPRPSVGLGLVAVALLVGWGAWATLARVAIYESSTSARLETSATVHRVETPTEGRVVELFVELGGEVVAGQPLVRLGSDHQSLALSEARARLQALEAQIAPLNAEIATIEGRLRSARKAAVDAVAEARARTEAAEASARTAQDEARRAEELKPNGAVSDEQLARAALEAERADAEARATRLSVTRLQWEHEVSDADARTRLETVRRELARIEGEAETARAHVGRLARQVDGQVIVAPITGRIAEQAPLNPGRFVAAGSHLMSVLPQGELRIVARFDPGPVFGRVRPGQPARMRLDGFPWTRFGMLGATVSRVAAETVDDEVRVELQLDDGSDFAAPLQHGLPGRVEIEVDRVRPLELLLRMAGQETGS